MAFKLHLLTAYVALCLLSLYHADAFNALDWIGKKPQLVGFKWGNCGPGTDPLQIKSIDVSPDPVKVPGNVTVGASFSLSNASPTDIGVSVTMEKKVAGFWIKVPCVDNVGSCNYGDLCGDWAKACPGHFEKYGIPCACPIPANTYSVPDLVVDITGKLPPGASGDLRVTGNLVSQSAGHLGCLQVEISLSG